MKRAYLNLYLSLSNFVLLAHVPFQWGALTGRGRLWGRPSGSRLTEPLPALSSLSSRVWVLLWVGRHWWPGRLVPGVTLHQHLFRTLECGLPREAFPQGVGKPAFGYLGQSKVFTTNMAKDVRSCLFFWIKLYHSVLVALTVLGRQWNEQCFSPGRKMLCRYRKCQCRR